MIQIDISNIWGRVDLPDLLAIEKEAFDAHETLSNGTGPGAGFRGWLHLPSKTTAQELERIQAAAEQIRSDSDVCVVVGIGGACTGARAAFELLQGCNRNFGKGKGAPQIFFAGNSLSTCHWQELVRLLADKDFSIIVISRSGETLEPAIAFRDLKWMLERRYGTEEASNRIYAVTDPEQGPLRQMTGENSWISFPLPTNVTDGYSVLTAAGLLPMAVAGIDIRAVMGGAVEAERDYDLRSFENPVWLYAAVRNLMHRQGMAVELIGSFEPGFSSFGQWWKLLLAGAEGKGDKGLFPAYADLTAELPALGQLILQGRRILFETMIRFDAPEHPQAVGFDVKDLEGLNYLAGKDLDFVQEQASLAAVEAHAEAGTPVITMDFGTLDEQKVGELLYFLELSCALSAYIMGVDPFDQSGAEVCRENMLRFLGKPMQE